MARGRRKQSTKADRRRRQRIAALDHPRRMGHETMLVVARPMAKAVDALVAKLSRPPGEPVQLASEDAFTTVPEVDEVLHGRGTGGGPTRRGGTSAFVGSRPT